MTCANNISQCCKRRKKKKTGSHKHEWYQVTVVIAIIYAYKLITCYHAYRCNHSITCESSKSSNDLSASSPFVSVSRDKFYCFNRMSNDLLFVSTLIFWCQFYQWRSQPCSDARAQIFLQHTIPNYKYSLATSMLVHTCIYLWLLFEKYIVQIAIAMLV